MQRKYFHFFLISRYYFGERYATDEGSGGLQLTMFEQDLETWFEACNFLLALATKLRRISDNSRSKQPCQHSWNQLEMPFTNNEVYFALLEFKCIYNCDFASGCGQACVIFIKSVIFGFCWSVSWLWSCASGDARWWLRDRRKLPTCSKHSRCSSRIIVRKKSRKMFEKCIPLATCCTSTCTTTTCRKCVLHVYVLCTRFLHVISDIRYIWSWILCHQFTPIFFICIIFWFSHINRVHEERN